jgi:protein-S-isoprenylcysteine O-methyltransferase
MKRFAMGLTVVFMTATGLALVRPLTLAHWALFTLLMFWAAGELYLGFSRPFEGMVPGHPLIRVSRGLWVVSVLFAWLDARYGWATVSVPPWGWYAGLALCTAGLFIRVWAVIHLGESFTYDVKRPPGSQFITSGPYRFVRHPSYLGLAILSTVPGLLVGSIGGFAGLFVTTVGQIVLRIRAEDAILEQAFAGEFLTYRETKRALLPWLY